MYENVTTLAFRCGRLDEALDLLRQSIVPVLRAQDGLLHLCLLPDRAHDKITVISLWTCAASARATESVGPYRREVNRLDPLLREPDDERASEPPRRRCTIPQSIWN